MHMPLKACYTWGGILVEIVRETKRCCHDVSGSLELVLRRAQLKLGVLLTKSNDDDICDLTTLPITYQ